MDAHLFRRFCEDLLPALIGARIEKIYQAADGILTFSLYGLGNVRQKYFVQSNLACVSPFNARKYYLTYKEGREAFLLLSHSRVINNDEPPASVMRLRKYLTGRHIKTATANWLERKIIFEVQDLWFEINLRDGVELYFSCPEQALCSPENDYFSFENSYRISPALNDDNFALYWADFSLLSQAADKEIWKEYQTLTPLLRKTLPYLPQEEQAALYADLQHGGGDVFVYTQNARQLSVNQSVENNPLHFAKNTDAFFISAWKLPQELLKSMGYSPDMKELIFENALEACLYIGDMVLAKIQKQNASSNVKQLQAQLKRLTRLEIKLAEEEERLNDLVQKKEQALLIQANLYQFQAEYKAEYIFVYDYTGKEVKILLDKAKTVRENMENYFHAAGRGMRGLEHLVRRKEELAREKQGLLDKIWEENAGASIKEPKAKEQKASQVQYGLLGKIKNVNNKAKFNQDIVIKNNKNAAVSKYPKEVQVFRSSDGFMILRGRDTKGNGLALKMASPYDVWVHIAEGTSAHVIIKRDHAKQEIPPQTMQEAGTLALLKSWVKGQEKGYIQYSYAKFIRPMKNAAQGLVHVDKSEGTLEIQINPACEEQLKIEKYE